MSAAPVPRTMRAIEMTEPVDDLDRALAALRVVEKPVPRPRTGEVLIRMRAAPCNPSDLLFLQGRYGIRKTMPTVPGWEGAGEVVAAGPGFAGRMGAALLARRLVGKRVACGGQSDADGTWAEYYVARATACVPLRDGVDFVQGACLLGNPLSAVGLLEEAREGGHAAAIQTGAASQLGRLVAFAAGERGLPVVHVVRRADQAETLRALGAEHVLDSSRDDFDEALKEEARALDATIAFDAVAGEMTGRLLAAMPAGSRVLVYGALSGEACAAIHPAGLIFRDQRVEGFYLGAWMRRAGFLKLARATRTIQGWIASGSFRTEIRGTYGLDDWPGALADYARRMSGGKVVLAFD